MIEGIVHFLFLASFCLVMWLLWTKWARLNDRQTIFVAALILLCVLGAELKEREVLRECGERIAEILETKQNVQAR